MKEKYKTDLWLQYWELYDKACWREYLAKPEFELAYKESPFELNRFMHDNILVPAFEEIEKNLKRVDDNSKFLFWFRFREEILIIGEDFKINKANLDKQLKPIFKEYFAWIKGSLVENKTIPDYEYFKWFYVSICELKETALMFFNEILFNLPVINKITVNKRNLELIEKVRHEKSISIYNYGNIDTLINSLENVSISKSTTTKNIDNLQVVETIIDNFKRQIEDNGMFKLLYESRDKKLRHENSAQQLFFSVSQIFCLANDLDVSPETNSGIGSVDFKFSKGASSKINVEIKYSNHRGLKHGLETQLQKYDKAEQTSTSFYVVIQVDDKAKIIDDILELDKKLNPNNQKVRIIDGRFQKSASVR